MTYANLPGVKLYKVDNKRFPLLNLVIEAAKKKNNALVVANGADEIAVDYFLKGKINFVSIYQAINQVVSKSPKSKIKTVDDLFYWDSWARVKTKEFLGK